MLEIYGDFYYNDFKKYTESGIKLNFPTKVPLFYQPITKEVGMIISSLHKLISTTKTWFFST